MDSREFAEWLAFNKIEPFGDARADLRSGIVASIVANCNRAKGAKAFKPTDFMPDFDAKPKEQSMEQMQSLLKIAASTVKAKK